jgi:hypothetical protein
MAQKMSDHIKEAVQADLRRDYWYKAGEATFNPSLPHMREPMAIEDYILAGWMPSEPFINPRSRVTFIGCCFGSALLKHLGTLDYEEPGSIDTEFIPISETLSTSFAMRQMFEWQFDRVKPDPAAMKGNRAVEINYSDDLWKGTLERLAVTDVFILMISSAEVWYDEPTGAVAWRETPGANPARQKFRTSTTEENRANFRTIYDVVRRHRPDAKIILLLSPIPMIATYRRQSCISINTVSKAVVRAAMDEVWREVGDEGHLLYCPFYEVIQEGFGANPYGGHYNGDRRHINDPALDYLLRLFEAYYCQIKRQSIPVLESYVAARVSTGDLPKALIEIVDRGDRRAIQNMIDSYEIHDDEQMADMVSAYAAERLALKPGPDTAEYVTAQLTWQTLPDLTLKGLAPLVLPIPPDAWDYGAICQPVQAEEGMDLLVRVTLEALSGRVGVFLARADGSAISTPDQVVVPQDGPTTLEMRVYYGEDPAHVVVRNHDNEGVAGSVRIDEVAMRPTSMLAAKTTARVESKIVNPSPRVFGA